MVEIYRYAKRRGIYPLLFTDPEGIVVLDLPNQMNKRNASSISSSETFAKRRAIFLSVCKTVKSMDIPSYGSQSKRAKIAIH